jgi:hypothetical protein
MATKKTTVKEEEKEWANPVEPQKQQMHAMKNKF